MINPAFLAIECGYEKLLIFTVSFFFNIGAFYNFSYTAFIGKGKMFIRDVTVYLTPNDIWTIRFIYFNRIHFKNILPI